MERHRVDYPRFDEKPVNSLFRRPGASSLPCNGLIARCHGKGGERCRPFKKPRRGRPVNEQNAQTAYDIYGGSKSIVGRQVIAPIV